MKPVPDEFQVSHSDKSNNDRAAHNGVAVRRKHSSTQLFAFTLTALSAGLSLGYYVGNNHSLSGLLMTPPPDVAVAPSPPVAAAVSTPTPFSSPAALEPTPETLPPPSSTARSVPQSSPQLSPSPSLSLDSNNQNPFDEYNRRAASSASSSSSSLTPTAEATLTASGLVIPVAGIKKENLVDTFTAARSEGRVHNALDIMAPKGTPVVAATDGKLLRFFQSDKGGLTIYQSSATSERTIFYYAHLAAYAENLQPGQMLKRGEVIGYVGDTGNAGAGNFHLHFAIWTVADPHHYMDGENINPYPLLTR